MSFKNKTAIVTGGSRGIGAAIVLKLAGEGANVLFTYSKSAQQAEETVQRAKGLSGKVVAIQADARKPEDMGAVVEKAMAEFGRLDILVNNAGVFNMKPFAETTLDEFTNDLNVNLKSAITLSHAAAEKMKTGGRIINISSIIGERAIMPGLTVYTTTKFALTGFTRSLAWDMGARGITVNTVQPGPVDTEMNPADSGSGMEKMTALGRYGKPEEVAAAVAFLASDSASYITGTTLNVDGGANA
ncbi:MAG: SDR family oxidoreductase [Proteobacteria bacterium]|nr:SDR family oxidoreductase [Pseudomonadota bacterium]